MSDPNGQLPPGWALAPIEDLFWPLEDGRTLHQGWSPLCEKTPAPTDEDWGVLKTTAIQAGAFLPQHNKHLPKHLTPRPQTEVKTGDILITCAGPRVRCGVACMVRHTRPRLMMSGKMYRFRVSPDDMDARYLEAFLLTPNATSAIDKMKTGGSDSGLNLTHDRFRPLPVPVAPLNEQRRIMDMVDELTSDLDAGVAALERVQVKLKHYRAAVLKAAVEGALTAEWRAQHPTTEPAADLLNRILAERRHRWEEAQLKKSKEAGKAPPRNWRTNYKEPVGADTANLPSLPDSWSWASIEQLIGEPLRNGHSAKVTDARDGIPTFSLSAVTDADFSAINIKNTCADPNKVRDLWVCPDDIFVQRSNTPDLVGTTCRYTGETHRAIFPDLMIRVRIAAPVLSSFVERSLQSFRCHAYFRKKAQGISGSMPKIDQEVIERCAIGLPSVPEQEAIVEAVEDQLSVIEHLEADLEAKLKSTQALRQSILRDAFTGQLVPQDPKDEPAAELLKRIAAQRENLARQALAAKKTKPKAPPKRAAKQTRKKPSHD
jgi:type I restriction enzyme S subunit